LRQAELVGLPRVVLVEVVGDVRGIPTRFVWLGTLGAVWAVFDSLRQAELIGLPRVVLVEVVGGMRGIPTRFVWLDHCAKANWLDCRELCWLKWLVVCAAFQQDSFGWGTLGAVWAVFDSLRQAELVGLSRVESVGVVSGMRGTPPRFVWLGGTPDASATLSPLCL
jgi:hypothetical protein